MKNISAFLIVNNEENLIEYCLKSIKDIVNEIIVVHDGPCYDSTLDIAKKYNAKIFVEKKPVNNPEYLKVKYLNIHKNKKSIFKNNYILSIDADEIIPLELKKEILELDLDNYDCYYIKRLNPGQSWCEGKYYLRLFNIYKVKLLGFLHEDFKPIKGAKVRFLRNYIFHNIKEKNKTVDWAKLEAKFLKKNFFNFYNYSNLDKIKIKIRFYLKRNIFLRNLKKYFLFFKYKTKYGDSVARKRLEYYEKVTKFIKNINS